MVANDFTYLETPAPATKTKLVFDQVGNERTPITPGELIGYYRFRLSNGQMLDMCDPETQIDFNNVDLRTATRIFTEKVVRKAVRQ